MGQGLLRTPVGKKIPTVVFMFDKIQNDRNLTVKGISIEGFASPEGCFYSWD